MGRPLIMPEIGVARAGGNQHQIVGNRASIHVNPFGCPVDAGHLAEQDADIRLTADEAAYRPGDVCRGQACRGDLVEQRLEEMMVAPVDERDVDWRPRQCARGGQPAESGADHDYLKAVRLRTRACRGRRVVG